MHDFLKIMLVLKARGYPGLFFYVSIESGINVNDWSCLLYESRYSFYQTITLGGNLN